MVCLFRKTFLVDVNSRVRMGTAGKKGGGQIGYWCMEFLHGGFWR